MNATKEPLDVADRSGGSGQKTRRTGALRTTAYHEAGHAVISAAVRRAVKRVTIVPEGDTAGSCHHPASLDELTHYGYRENAEGTFLKALAVVMAGTIAGCLSKGQRPRWTVGAGLAGSSVLRVEGRRRRVLHADGDLGEASDIVLHLVPDDEEEQAHLSDRVWRLTARELRTRWPQVRAVAEALLEKRNLSGHRTLRIIRAGGGRTGPLAAALSVIARERRLSLEKLRRQKAREWLERHPEGAGQLRELAEGRRHPESKRPDSDDPS